ncbi:MAG: ComF family protein, partial [Clostridium sp.]|nr:ComF family protein [Clostridium sp.]
MNPIQSVTSHLLDLLFPRRCPVCAGIVMPRGNLICPDC